jgi:flagellar biosynthesis/type III secretory pathway protein FliH
MPLMPTIRLPKPLAAARVRDVAPACAREGLAGRAGNHHPAASDPALPHEPPSNDLVRELRQQQAELARLLQTVNRLAGSLRQLHERTLAEQHAEIAQLAVEIARRILMYKVGKGDYEIQAIVEQALQQAPPGPGMVVHLNPEDLPRCQQLQQENPQSPLAELELLPDGSIGRGECLVETPKGIVKSFIEEQLEHLSAAMQRVE